MNKLPFDVRYVIRRAVHNWRFSLGVVLTLGLGVGLGLPVLTLADHFFLRAPAGVKDPGRVMRLMERAFGPNGPYVTEGLTGLDYAVMRRARTLDGVAAWIVLDRSLGTGTGARVITAGLTSASFFPVLGVRPLIGRFYTEGEDVEGAAQPPCVVSYLFWKATMGAANDAIGHSLFVGATRYTVVGVAPPAFNGVGLSTVDVWLPLHVASPDWNGNDSRLWTTDESSWLRIVARIKPRVSRAQAAAEAQVLYRRAGPRTRDRKLEGSFIWDPLQPGRSSRSTTSANIVLWLGAGGTLLLLLVAANLVNLFVARSAASARQIAVRLAVGAGWRNILGGQMAEALVLAVAAASLGLSIAIPAGRAARVLLLPGTSWAPPLIDGRVAVIAFTVAFVIGAVAALWTTASSLSVDAADLLRTAASARVSGAAHAHAFRRALLVVQAGIFAVLLAAALAFVASLRRASRVDFGFDVRSVMAASIPLPAEMPRVQARDLMSRARDRIAVLPTVESASLGYMEPWSNNTSVTVSVPGADVKPPLILFDIAGPDYLRTFGVRMQAGRWIESSDIAGSPPVIVINQSLEHIFWPAGGAIGRCLRVGADTMPCRAIIGVVRDFRVTGTADDVPKPVYYIPVAQSAAFPQRPRLFFRPRGDPTVAATTVREALQLLDSRLPAVGVHPITDNLRWLTASLELGVAAFTAFGVVAAIVGAVGLYSVLSFLIVEQRRTHAIRSAIGATPARVAGSVFGYAAATTALGLAAAYAVLVGFGRLLPPLLFHTGLLEGPLVAAVVGVVAVTATAAAFFPALTVVRTDVMSVLREQ